MVKKKARVTSKRLDQLNEAKLALAIVLITEGMVEDETSPPSDAAGKGNGESEKPSKEAA
jgi:hypothetical protein